MLRRRAWLCLATLLLFGPESVTAAPLEAYGRLPAIENVAITPNGKLLALATEVKGKRTLLIYDIDSSQVRAGLVAGDQKLRDLRWADDDRLLITTSSTSSIIDIIGPRQEYWITGVYSLSTGQSRSLLIDAPGESLNVSAGPPQSRTIEGHTVVFVEGIHFIDRFGVLTLFAVDLGSRRTKIVQTGNKNSEGWWIDETGQIIAATEYDNDSRHWLLKLKRDGEWREAYSVTAAVDPPRVIGITADGNSLALETFDNNDTGTTWLNLADGSSRPPATSYAALDVPLEDPATHRLIGGEQTQGHRKYVFFNSADQLAWNSVAHAFPDENVRLVTWSADRKRIVVLVDGTRNGSQYMIIDLKTSRATSLGLAYRDIYDSDVASVKFIHYAAADGTDIPAYLTLPNGRAAKGLPLVVLPHGGPLAEDTPEFDWWSQALASRGYAVLQPEFRGSDGYGWSHTVAGFGQWGRKMQTDLSDGVRYLANAGTVDPKRVCIVGGSYGGYAALAGPTLDRGVYRCSVSVAGISDPHGFLRWLAHRQRKTDSLPVRFWTRFMGVASDDDPKLSEISPQSHAASADAPILLIHGSDDTVVPIEQSEDMADALKAAGKPVTFIKLKSEDHWLSRTETREQMLTATVDFLEKNNPPN